MAKNFKKKKYKLSDIEKLTEKEKTDLIKETIGNYYKDDKDINKYSKICVDLINSAENKKVKLPGGVIVEKMDEIVTIHKAGSAFGILATLLFGLLLVSLVGATYSFAEYSKIRELNKDINGDGIADINIDINKNRKADINIDTDNDNKPNVNIDYRSNRKAIFNISNNENEKKILNKVNQDINNDGVCDINCDIDNDGWPDINLDINGDGIIDLNKDINGDKIPDLNFDMNDDMICDLHCDTTSDNICDSYCLTINELEETQTTIPGARNENNTSSNTETNNNNSANSNNNSTNSNNTSNDIATDNNSNNNSNDDEIIKPTIDKTGEGKVKVETGELVLEFYDENSVLVTDVYPDDQPHYTGTIPSKKFKVTNKSNIPITYNLKWVVLENDYETENFKYKVSSTNNGASFDYKVTPKITSDIVTNVEIPGNTTQEYTVDFNLFGTGTNQNEDAGKIFHAYIDIYVD